MGNIEHFNKCQQLCWTCKKVFATDMIQCDWLSEHKEVEGWTAKETIHDIIDGVPQKSYSITACPLYEKHTYKRVK
jgi:hypothetical protein